MPSASRAKVSASSKRPSSTEHHGEVVHLPGEGRVHRPEDPATDRQRLAVGGLRFDELPAPAQHRTEVAQVAGDAFVDVAVGLPVDDERLAKHRLGLRVFRPRDERRAQIVERIGDPASSPPSRPRRMSSACRWPASAAANSPRSWSRRRAPGGFPRRRDPTGRTAAGAAQRLLEERPRALAQPQPLVDPADDQRERRLRLGLVLELGHRARRALVQDLPRRQRLPAGLAGIGPGEHLLEQARELQGLVALRPDLVALTSEPDGLHGHRGGQAEDRRQADRRHRDPALWRMHELPRAVPQGVRLRRHGQLLAVAPQVLGQEPDRCVAPAGLLAQRHQDDVVEVAL